MILRVNHYHFWLEDVFNYSVLSLLVRSVGNILLGKENVNVFNVCSVHVHLSCSLLMIISQNSL